MTLSELFAISFKLLLCKFFQYKFNLYRSGFDFWSTFWILFRSNLYTVYQETYRQDQ